MIVTYVFNLSLLVFHCGVVQKVLKILGNFIHTYNKAKTLILPAGGHAIILMPQNLFDDHLIALVSA